MYETWSIALREEHRLRVFENRVLRKMFGLNRDESKFEKLNNENLSSIQWLCSPNRALASSFEVS
jgi:hypothetical protein